MLSLSFPGREPLKVLCLGAHCDDIEIGCAGTLDDAAGALPGLELRLGRYSRARTRREQETRKAARPTSTAARPHESKYCDFRMSYLPFQGAEVKDHFETIKRRIEPYLIFTHRLEDRHQDHRLIAELTWNTFRNHLVLEYEIPKYEGDLGQPNLLRAAVRRRRRCAQARDADELLPVASNRAPGSAASCSRAHLRLRGIECNAPSGCAEAFHARKAVHLKHAKIRDTGVPAGPPARRPRNALCRPPVGVRADGRRAAADHGRRRIPRLLPGPVGAALERHARRRRAHPDRGLRQLRARRAGLARSAARASATSSSCGRT